MDSTKKFFDAWVDTQTQLVDNLVDTSKKFQESLQKGEISEKSAEIYSNWADKQSNIMDNMVSSISKNGKLTDTPEFMKEWIDAQKKFGETLLDSMKGNNSTQPVDMFQNIFQENMQKSYGDWTKAYQQMTHQFGKPLEQYMPGDLTKNTFMGFIDNTRNYMKMFELWQPIYKMLQTQNSMDNWKQFVDMGKYQEVLDSMFKAMNLSDAKELMENLKGYQNLFGDFMTSGQNSFAGQFGNLQDMMPNSLMNNNLEALAGMNTSFANQFYKFTNPYFAMMPNGNEKDFVQLVHQNQELYVKYYIKSTEMQNLINTEGQQAMEKVIKSLMAKTQETGEAVSFDDFYNEWVNSIENDMITLFGGDAFSKIQGELLSAGLHIKQNLDKQMEIILAPLPVVPRSEVDELNKTIHELKMQVRKLERKVNGTATKSATKTTAKKTTTTRKKATTTTTKKAEEATKTGQES